LEPNWRGDSATDKLLVVLSKDSLRSPWVEREIEAAHQQEIQQSITKIFPIRIDDFVFQTKQSWVTDLLQTRVLADFSRWSDSEIYQRALSRLVRDLNATVAAESGKQERRP